MDVPQQTDDSTHEVVGSIGTIGSLGKALSPRTSINAKAKKKEAKKDRKGMKKEEKMMKKETRKEEKQKKKMEKDKWKQVGEQFSSGDSAAMRELESAVLGDYNREKGTHKTLESFLAEVASKISKQQAKMEQLLDDRKAVASMMSLQADGLREEGHTAVGDVLNVVSNLCTYQVEMATKMNNVLADRMTALVKVTNVKGQVEVSDTVKREFNKLMDRYVDTEEKIAHAKREKEVTVSSMEKISEAENARDLIKSRLKELGHMSLMQLKTANTERINTLLEALCGYVLCARDVLSDGVKAFTEAAENMRKHEAGIERTRNVVGVNRQWLDTRTNELGDDKAFKKIIKKKSKKEGEKDRQMSPRSKKMSRRCPMLHVVASEGKVEMLNTLLDSSPDEVNIEDALNWTSLHHACHRGHLEVVETLLRRGASVSPQASDGNTPLHLASSKGFEDCVTALVEAKAMVNAQNRDDNTALHLAVRMGHASICKLLLAAGADVDLESSEGSVTDLVVEPDTPRAVMELFGDEPVDSSNLTPVLRPKKKRRAARAAKVLSLSYGSSGSPIFPRLSKKDSTELDAESTRLSSLKPVAGGRLRSSTSGVTVPAGPHAVARSPRREDPPELDTTDMAQAVPRQFAAGSIVMMEDPEEEWAVSPRSDDTSSGLSDSEQLLSRRGSRSPDFNTDIEVQEQFLREKWELNTSNDSLDTPASPIVAKRSLPPLPPTPGEKREDDDDDDDELERIEDFARSRRRRRSMSLNLNEAQALLLQRNLESSAADPVEYSDETFTFEVIRRIGGYPHKLTIRLERDTMSIFKRRKLKKKRSCKLLMQCVKAVSNPKKLKLHWKFQKQAEVYEFQSVERRERFVETVWLAQHGLTNYPYNSSSPTIRLFIGTWNMGSAPPTQNFDSWVPKDEYDIYVIAVQECTFEPRDGHSVESDLFGVLQGYLGDGYIKLVGLSMSEIRMVVLVKREHHLSITKVKKGNVACGVANVMGNKGAVGFSFKFHETSFCFVGAHLAAHQEKMDARNADYRQIVRGLSPQLYQVNNQRLDITNQFDHIFWVGDLNYRIDLPRDEVLSLIEKKKWNKLLQRDQLTRELERGKSFVGFHEETIVFRPTYKYEIGSRTKYGEEKPLRVPAWCDRVLFKSNPGSKVEHESYGCCDEMTTSDHHPVFCTFSVQLRLPNLPHMDIIPIRIVLSNVKITELRFAYNEGAISPYLLLSAPFLEPAFKVSHKEKTRNPDWSDEEIILTPFVHLPEYLTTECLRVVVGDKSKIVQEKHRERRWAQGAIPLHQISLDGADFEIELSSYAYAGCGQLSGHVRYEFLSN